MKDFIQWWSYLQGKYFKRQTIFFIIPFMICFSYFPQKAKVESEFIGDKAKKGEMQIQTEADWLWSTRLHHEKRH